MGDVELGTGSREVSTELLDYMLYGEPIVVCMRGQVHSVPYVACTVIDGLWLYYHA